ncbi:MAG: ACP S-malonyltransferase [Pseudomonadota bacterium]
MANIAVVFPGQGSQYVGMGKAFYEADADCRRIFALAAQASGLDLARLCFEGPLDELTLTVNLQPAVVAVDLCAWLALDKAGLAPMAVAGHSLGEYPALAAAGALSPEACLELVSLRGRLMDREANAHPGAMSAIMGLAPEAVAQLCADAGGPGGVVQPANYNTGVQTVITGAAEAVARAGALAKERGAKAIPLKVSGAWHSPLMAAAGRDMADAPAPLDFTPLKRVIAPNLTGQPTMDMAQAKAALVDQLTSPVRWVQSVEAMLEMGVDVFIEAGPKNVLAGLIKKIAPATVRVFNVEDPAGVAKTLAELG